jgi:hypothetical protein
MSLKVLDLMSLPIWAASTLRDRAHDEHHESKGTKNTLAWSCLGGQCSGGSGFQVRLWDVLSKFLTLPGPSTKRLEIAPSSGRPLEIVLTL